MGITFADIDVANEFGVRLITVVKDDCTITGLSAKVTGNGYCSPPTCLPFGSISGNVKSDDNTDNIGDATSLTGVLITLFAGTNIVATIWTNSSSN